MPLARVPAERSWITAPVWVTTPPHDVNTVLSGGTSNSNIQLAAADPEFVTLICTK